MKWKCFGVLLLFTGLSACGNKDNTKGDDDKESVSIVLPSEEVEVSAETLLTKDFPLEIVSNGRISAQEVAELRFVNVSSGNTPVKIFVKNGDRVKAGDAIAMLDTFLLSNSYSQALVNLQKANLDLRSVLLGLEYDPDKLASIPEDIYRIATIRSGYLNIKTQYDIAKYHLENAVLRTPIAGMVINLFAKPYNPIDVSAPFCIIINDGKLEIDFPILENELPFVKKNDQVRVQSYASPDIQSFGTVADINPSVDRDGLVRVKAFVQPHPKIFNGMNVRVSVFRSEGLHWVVPKSAVVLRTNKQVVFAFKEGKAAWHYVEKGLENATHCVITSETLKEGDEIIYSGNEHLADGSKVKLIKEGSD